MRPIDSLLDSFQIHYSDSNRVIVYTDANRRELISRYMWVSPAYMLVLYNEVTASHPAALRSLPDVAVLEKAIARLGRQETYNKPVPIEDTRRDEDAVRRLVQSVGPGGSPEDRERVRYKVSKGRATREEVWWLQCIDGGAWKPMPKTWTAVSNGG